MQSAIMSISAFWLRNPTLAGGRRAVLNGPSRERQQASSDWHRKHFVGLAIYFQFRSLSPRDDVFFLNLLSSRFSGLVQAHSPRSKSNFNKMWPFAIRILIVTPLVSCAAGPFFVTTSSNRYGPDGPWYAISIQLGTPPQHIDVYPSGIYESVILSK